MIPEQDLSARLERLDRQVPVPPFHPVDATRLHELARRRLQLRGAVAAIVLLVGSGLWATVRFWSAGGAVRHTTANSSVVLPATVEMQLLRKQLASLRASRTAHRNRRRLRVREAAEGAGYAVQRSSLAAVASAVSAGQASAERLQAIVDLYPKSDGAERARAMLRRSFKKSP